MNQRHKFDALLLPGCAARLTEPEVRRPLLHPRVAKERMLGLASFLHSRPYLPHLTAIPTLRPVSWTWSIDIHIALDGRCNEKEFCGCISCVGREGFDAGTPSTSACLTIFNKLAWVKLEVGCVIMTVGGATNF